MIDELTDLALLWAALMIAGGTAVLLWLLTDWLFHPERASRPTLLDERAPTTTLLVPRRLMPGDPDNGLRQVPVIPGRGSRLVTDSDIAELERWLREQTRA